MDHYLVTGGAGFIGSNLVRTLLDQGNTVRILDNLSTGKRELIDERAEFQEGDIRNPKDVARACSGMNGVFHVAALPRVEFSIQNPRETHEVNATGTLNVILCAKDAGVRRIVYSASSSAYGDPISLPLREHMKTAPKSPYALQKLFGEEYVRLAALFWNLETVSLRYFNVYGPNMATEGAYATVMTVFQEQKRKGLPMTITGDGTQTRDFTFVDDVVRANMLAMTSPNVGHGEVLNIGTGENHSVNEIAERMDGPTAHIEPRIEPHDTLADTTAAKDMLGWSPRVDFSDGFAKTMEWFAQQ